MIKNHSDDTVAIRFPKKYSRPVDIYGYAFIQMIILNMKVSRAFSNLLIVRKDQVKRLRFYELWSEIKFILKTITVQERKHQFNTVFISNCSNDIEEVQECSFSPDNQIAGEISRADINETIIAQVKESPNPLDCLWTIQVKPDWKVRTPYLRYSLYQLCCSCARN